MSRIGKMDITIPAGVKVEAQGVVVVIKGAKGELRQNLHPHMAVSMDEGHLRVMVKNENDRRDRALWGTFASLLRNMIIGVTVGFKKQLEINGVGFKAAANGESLVLEVGFSHPVTIPAMPGVRFSVEKNIITVEGIDKQAVGEMAARIRGVKEPEPYKGKGIKYVHEIVRRKAGKAAAKSAA